MTRRMEERLERAERRDRADAEIGAAAGEAAAERGDLGGEERQSRLDEAGGEAVLDVANAAAALDVANAAVVSSGDVARSVETARRAAVMDVVPAWASAGRDGPIPDVAPPRTVARLVEEQSEAMEELAEVVDEARGKRNASSPRAAD
jgi:hypothetical protein